MCVKKRNGVLENVSFDKILARVKTLGAEHNISINYITLVIKIIDQLYDKIETSKIDELTAAQAASMSSIHPDYGTLASVLVTSNLHKKTDDLFSCAMNKIYNFKDINKISTPLLADKFIDIVNKHANFFDELVDHNRDYLIDFFGFKTLERGYLIHVDKVIIERPQYLWLRVAICIHEEDLCAVKETYDLMSQKYFTHATPTLFNAGTPKPQLSSCFLIAMESDSVDGIYNTLKECANISKWAGGIGLHIHNVRANGSHIRGTNGDSGGIVPMLAVFNKTARYINQGGRRNGSFAIYIEPHHADIEEYLDLKKNHGDEELRARDLFYALWISDLFMERVKANAQWSLFCPDSAPGLSECHNDDFKNLYQQYEDEKRYIRQVNARDLWIKILDAQMETGTPYILYKDAANRKSNQQNLGTIMSSNLCVAPETLILTDKGQIQIQELKNKVVNVWNGKEFSEVEVKQTNDNSELITITFSDGAELTCTKYHKFYIQNGNPTYKIKADIITSKKVELVEAQYLQKDMKLIKCEYPTIDFNNDIKLEHAYTNGFFSGDGTYSNITNIEERKCHFKSITDKAYCKRHINYQQRNETSEYCCSNSYMKKPHVTLYGEKIKLLEHLDYISTGMVHNNKLNVTLNVNLEEKYFVPINYSLKSKLDWLSGYSDADGSIAHNGANQSLQIGGIHKEFLLNIKLMLQTCGVASKVTLCREAGTSYLPNGKGEYEYYNTQPLWRLLVTSNDLMKLLDLGFNCKRLIIKKETYQRSATQFVKIVNIENKGRFDKTFCFNESKRHAGIFNGIITSNCSEIIEFSSPDETAVCNLASIGLSNFIIETKSTFSDVVVYTKDNCNWCTLLKALLKRKSVEFKEIKLETREEIARFKEIYGVATIPQLIDDNKLVGGFNQVLDILRNQFDYERLHHVVKIITRNLNRVIDVNFYPTEKTRRSNLFHRPIGIGVQGLADAFIMMDIAFHSDAAKDINIKIFETIYHAALEQSMELSHERNSMIEILKQEYMGSWSFKTTQHDSDNDICQDYTVHDYTTASSTTTILNEENVTELLQRCKPIRREIERNMARCECYGSYSSFEGSPASRGILQFDMWNVVPSSGRYDWSKLKSDIQEYGLRNSLLVAPMPTASTSQILGNNECFEPLTSNIYTRRTLAGEFVLANKYLIKELIELGIWNDDIKTQMIVNKGSIQAIGQIPQFIKEKYKIVWEIPMRHLIDMSRDRGAYVCQSQSLNLWLEDPDAKSLTNMHFYSWNAGLKTGMYYLRRKPKAQPQQFTVEPIQNERNANVKNSKNEGKGKDEAVCDMCAG